MQAGIEPTKAAKDAVRKADNPVNNARPKNEMPRSSSPALRQPMFDWKAIDKNHVLHNFGIEVKKILVKNNTTIQESETVPIILNWLGHEGLRFVQMPNNGKIKMENNHRAG